MALEIGKTYKNEYGSNVEIVAIKHGDYIGYVKESNTAAVYDRRGKSLQLTFADLIVKQEYWVEIYKNIDGTISDDILIHKSMEEAVQRKDDRTIKIVKVEL